MSRRNSAGAGTSEERAGGEFPPAASAVLAAPKKTVEDAKPVVTFANIDEVRERSDKPVRERDEDWLNEAIQENRYVLNASMHGWYRMRGQLRFSVTRFYPRHRIAVDFPRQHENVKVVEEKRDVLRNLGIVYVAILFGESLTPETVLERIDAERAAIEDLQKTTPPAARAAGEVAAVAVGA